MINSLFYHSFFKSFFYESRNGHSIFLFLALLNPEMVILNLFRLHPPQFPTVISNSRNLFEIAFFSFSFNVILSVLSLSTNIIYQYDLCFYSLHFCKNDNFVWKSFVFSSHASTFRFSFILYPEIYSFIY